MKKYLIITQRCPYPPYKTGGVHTIYNILKNIPSNVKIDLFYYYEKDPEAEMHISKMVNKIIFSTQRRFCSTFLSAPKAN